MCVCSTIQVITNLVKMVKARDIRRPFCPKGHWLSEEVNIRADKVLDCDHNLDICLFIFDCVNFRFILTLISTISIFNSHQFWSCLLNCCQPIC